MLLGLFLSCISTLLQFIELLPFALTRFILHQQLVANSFFTLKVDDKRALSAVEIVSVLLVAHIDDAHLITSQHNLILVQVDLDCPFFDHTLHGSLELFKVYLPISVRVDSFQKLGPYLLLFNLGQVIRPQCLVQFLHLDITIGIFVQLLESLAQVYLV